MKKIITIIAIVAAAFTASADYLYWMIDFDDADTFTSSISKSYNNVKLQVVSGNGGSTPYTVVRTLGTWSDTFDDIAFGATTEVADYSSSGTYSFLVELYNDSDWVAQSTALAWASASSYVGGNTLYTPAGGSWVASGFNVPEPTSGLLMLVGGMLLALKRRKMA